jgi:transcriptional regulator with XRE-family HTH domain
MSMPVKFKDMMRELFTARERAAIRRTAAGIAKRHMALRELRQARNRTQVSMAKRLGVKQVSISRLESRADPRLSTLTRYIDAMGGQLHLIVEFPEHEPVLLRNVGKTRAKTKNKAA